MAGKAVSAEKLQGFSSVREYKPLNKYCYYSLLDTLQKCLHCGTSKNLPAEPEIPEIPEILSKWKAPTVTDWGIEMLFSTIYIMFTIYWIK